LAMESVRHVKLVTYYDYAIAYIAMLELLDKKLSIVKNSGTVVPSGCSACGWRSN